MSKMDWRRVRHRSPPVTTGKVNRKRLRDRARRYAAALLFRSMKRRLLRTLPTGIEPSDEQAAARRLALTCHADRVEVRRDLVIANWQLAPRREVTARLKAFGFKWLSDPKGYTELLGGGNWWYYDCARPRGRVVPSLRPPI